MLLNPLAFCILLLLLLLPFPQAESTRAKFLAVHSRHVHLHKHHRSSASLQLKSVQQDEASKPHIGMVTELKNGKRPHDSSSVNIDMVVESSRLQDDVQGMGGMLDTSVSGPNPGGNSEILAATTQTTTIGQMFDTAVSGPNPGGNSQSNSDALGNMLDTPVSGPNPGGNSNTLTGMLDIPVSGSNSGENSQILSVSLDGKSVVNMLDTPVSGFNPGGNSETLVSVPKAEGTTAPAISVSGPNTGGNSESLAVSGPNPGGNRAKTLGSMLDTPVSGPNLGGNSQILVVSGPNPGGNSDPLVGSRLDTPVSGPNPGGNSQNLGNKLSVSLPSSCGVSCRDAEIASMLDTPVSGPNPGGNAATLGNRLDASVSEMLSMDVGPISVSDVRIVEAKVERGAGGSLRQATKERVAAFGSRLSERAEVEQAGEAIFSELPSGPSHSHSSVVTTEQALFPKRPTLVGCEGYNQEGVPASSSDSESIHSGRFQHLEALIKSINSMGAVRDDS
ncbi:hypothetical protein L7F22_050559 [Adiantum nelumboides]|nr:hypothetical protein [Adiantum nelumboides]